MHRNPLAYFFLTVFLSAASFSFNYAAEARHGLAIGFPVCLLSNTTTDTVPPKPDEPFVLRPSFALGIGMLSFFGDHNENHVSNPQYGRLGYDLFIAQKLSSSLSAGLYVLFGKVAANTQTASTHFNFESQIRTGGLQFRPALQKERPQNKPLVFLGH
jgi:hypothetical protein